MKDISKYQAAIPAFYTCYDGNGEVDREKTISYAKMLANKGVKGLYLCGSSGECVYLEEKERMRSLEYVVEAVSGKMTIIAHVAAPSTAQSVRLARHARECGCDALSAMPPLYYREGEDALADYWNAIADAGQTDFFIYNIPSLSGYTLSERLLRRMLRNPYVAGMKNTSLPAQDMLTYKALGGENFVVFNGPDEQYVSGRLMGADGGIGATYSSMPELFIQMEALVQKGDFTTAMQIQRDVCAIISDMFACDGSLYAVCKAVIREQCGFDFGGVRAPLMQVTEADSPRIRAISQRIEKAVAKWTQNY